MNDSVSKPQNARGVQYPRFGGSVQHLYCSCLNSTAVKGQLGHHQEPRGGALNKGRRASAGCDSGSIVSRRVVDFVIDQTIGSAVVRSTPHYIELAIEYTAADAVPGMLG